MKNIKISECAPTKVILCGEHFVVYGEKAIAIPSNLKNCAKLIEKGKKNTLKIIGKTGTAAFNTNKKISGQSSLHSFAQVYLEIMRKKRIKKHKGIEIKLIYSGAPKGMGNSASLACAIAKALAEYFRFKPTRQQLFNLVQLSEKVAHSNPSGIDARTIVEESAQIFRRPSYFKKIKINAPKNCAFCIIDTSRGKKPQAKTSLLVKKFTKFIKAKKGRIAREKYKRIFGAFCRQIQKKNPSPHILGNLMGQNHALLREGGVSSNSIERAIKSISPFAYGAKLTGAGGEGGAVLALINKGKIRSLKREIQKTGFKALPLNSSPKS